jgi:parallel beta-helix repeat protein
VTFKNLNLQNANGYGLSFVERGASNIIVNGCTVGHAYYMGISSAGSAETQSVIIKNCTVNWNGSCGINVDKPSHHWTIQDNIVHNNSQVYIPGDDHFLYSGGIKGWAGDDSVKGIIIQRNKVYSQGKLPDGTRVSTDVAAAGIWPDTFIHANYTDGVLITRNEVYDNQRAGIFIENGSYATVSYNLVYNNNVAGADSWGIRVSDRDAISPANYNRIYNNTVYGNGFGGIGVSGSKGSESNRCIGNEVRNNIVIGNGSDSYHAYQLYCEYGGENDGMMGSGNVYLNNAFGAESTRFIMWGHSNFKATYADWYAEYPTANGNTIQGDPIFVDVSTHDFHLQPSSPAIDAGTNIGLTSDYEGNDVPFGPAPDIGAYEYHSGSSMPPAPQGIRILP